jgi:putative aldouronate transport system substrate-binding protein
MVMSGGSELPDIIIVNPGDAMVFQWAREGAINPIKKYYDNPSLSPNIRDALSKAGYDFKAEITSPDGEIYGIPQVYQLVGNEFSGKFWYYKPWVDRLGLKVPSTTDELRAFLQGIVKSNVSGSGRGDEIGMTGQFRGLHNSSPYGMWFHYMMNPFIYVGDQLINVEKGVVSAPYNTEAWRTGLKYIRSLFADGLLPLENLTQDQNQIITLLNSDPVRVGSFFFSSGSAINSSAVAEQYLIGPPLRGANGTQYSTCRPSVANIRFMISANCKNPEAAFRVGDVMMREDLSISNRFGEQGLNWDYPEAVPGSETRFTRFLEDWPGRAIIYDDSSYWGGSAVQNSGWRQNGPLCLTYAILHGRLLPPAAVDGRQINNGRAMTMYNMAAFAPNEVLGKLIYTQDEISVVSEIQSTLNSYVLEMTSNFLAGNRDIDATWNSYIAELNSIGLPRFLSIVQTVYNRMYKK